MGDSSQAQFMVKDQEPMVALEGMEKMTEAKAMKPQAKCILWRQVLQVCVHVQVHRHGYMLGACMVPKGARASENGPMGPPGGAVFGTEIS